MHRRIILLLMTLLPSVAFAVPSLVRTSGSDDDATIYLTVERETIRGDTRSYCQLRIVVSQRNEPFSRGDRVYLWVEENDGLSSQTVWELNFEINGPGSVDRTFDCSQVNGLDNPFPIDDGLLVDNSDINLSARARVEKDECGIFCRNDRPETGTVDIPVKSTDGADANDGALDGNNPRIPPGLTDGRIARDDDWYRIDLDIASVIRFQANYRVGYGALDVELFDRDQTSLVNGADNNRGNGFASNRLAAGVYYVKVSPRVNRAYNFYDVNLSLIGLPGECNVGAPAQRQSCGNCGSQTRTCQADETWSEWGPCESQGVCRPGTSQTVSCGNRCGEERELCNDSCEWEGDGECRNEGQCTPGSTDVEVCQEGDRTGERERTCDELCNYSPFGPCSFCEPGTIENCFDGPPDVCDLETGRCEGICTVGARTCLDGAWSMCGPRPGEAPSTLPVEGGETGVLCDNGVDDDCDGQTDGNDDGCFVCGNGILEGGEQCDGEADCSNNCEVIASTLCSGAPINGGYSAGSYDEFIFTVNEETTITIEADGANDCAGMTSTLKQGEIVVARDDDGGCISIDALLEPATYTLRIGGDQALENYTLTMRFDDGEMGGIPADYNPIQCAAPPVGGADVGGISGAGGIPSPDEVGGNIVAGTPQASGEQSGGEVVASAGIPSNAAGKPGDFGGSASPGGIANSGGATSPPPSGTSGTTGGGMAAAPGGVATGPTAPSMPTTPSGTAGESMNPGSLGMQTGTTDTPSMMTGGALANDTGSVTSASSSGCDCDSTQGGHNLSWILLGLGVYLVRRRHPRVAHD